MSLIQLAGINYKQTPIEIREKLSFDEHGCRDILSFFKKDKSIQEAILLSTCNRTEFYIIKDESISLNGQLPKVLLDVIGIPDFDVNDHFYKAANFDAVSHLFRVTAGLDSMVVGEDQILAQVKQAYTIAVEHGLAGKYFHKIFHQAFRVGKRSRTETKISSGAASIGSVAVDLSKKIFSNLSDKNVLMIGAGDIAQVTLTNLKKRGVNKLFITNRTKSKAESVAREFDASVLAFEHLEQALSNADVVISSTSSKQAIISNEMIRNAMIKRKNSPLFLIDIAVPRDIDKSVKDLYNVFLYDIDDLKDIVDKNLMKRRNEILKVEKIIQEELDEYLIWNEKLQVLPTIKQLQEHFEDIRQREISRYQKNFVKEDWEKMDKFSRSLLKKFLHSPMVRLHECKDMTELCGRCTIREVFGLDEDE